MSPIELSWAAGLFEGEGSIRISKPSNRNWGSLIVSVPNTDLQIVDFFASRWHGSVNHVLACGRRKCFWRWTCSTRKAVTFLGDIRDYLVTDRVKAKLEHGLWFQSQKRDRRSDEEYRQAQWEAYWWMAELNARGNQEVEQGGRK